MARSLFVPISLAAALTLAGCASSTPEATSTEDSSCAGVQLLVDYADLGPAPVDECVSVSGSTSAADVLAAAGLSTEGTADYGDAIVCRVSGKPAATDIIATTSGDYSETCATMPSADAYWSLWVKRGGAWDYAQVGFNELQLAPGEGLALSFNVNNTATAPSNSSGQ